MEAATRLASKDKIIRKKTVRDIKGYKSQSLMTQAEGREGLVAFIPAVENNYTKMEDEGMAFSTELSKLKKFVIKKNWRKLEQCH